MSLSKSKAKGSARQTGENSHISTSQTSKPPKNGKAKKRSVPVNGNGGQLEDHDHSGMNGNSSKKLSSRKKGLNKEINEQLVGSLDNKELLKVLMEVKNGNFSVRMPIDQMGLSGKICDTLNEIISLNEKMMQEFTRAGNTIGKQGKLDAAYRSAKCKRFMEHRC